MPLLLTFSIGLMYHWGWALIINSEDYRPLLPQREMSALQQHRNLVAVVQRHIYLLFRLFTLPLSPACLPVVFPLWAISFPPIAIACLHFFHPVLKFKAFIDFAGSRRTRRTTAVESTNREADISSQLNLTPPPIALVLRLKEELVLYISIQRC